MTRTPGEYVYHAGYLPRGLESVKRKGLIPSKHGYAGSGVYFAYEPDEGFYHVDAADATMFRVRWADLVDKFGVYPKNPNGIQRDDQEIIVPNTVPAGMLEVEYFPGEWWDINSAAAADRGPPVNEAVLVTDVPREEWLEDKIAYAKKRGRDSFGVPYTGSTTAYVRQPSHVVLPVSLLARIPGARGEQKNVRQGDLTAIMKIMKDTGKLPLTSSGEEYKPFVCVAWNGEPWVMEGNHRIMAAKQLGWETLPVELKYFDGGERIRSGVLYPGKIGLGDVNNSHETDEDPLVVVYDKDGELHTHANLSVANNIFRTNVKPNDVIKEPVKVKSGGSYGEVTFALSKHHKSESLNPAPGTSVVMNEEPIKLKSQDTGRAREFIDAVYARYPHTFQNNHVMSWGSGDEQEIAMFELVPSFGRPNAVEIKWIQAYPLRKGVGSRAMKELQGMAQEHGVALTLFPWDKGRVSQAKLMKFYRGHGFQPTVKGAKNMIWHPEVAEASLATMRDYFAGNDKAKDPTKLSVMRNYFNQVDGSTNVNRAPGKSGKNPAGIPPEIQALVNKMYHSGKISPQEYEILRKFQQQTKINVGVREAEENNKCPPATQDITLNLENRQKAIDEYGYGPLNPDLPNNKFWMKKVDEWNLDSPEEAKQSLCGNCAAFDQRQATLDCIADGIDSNDPESATAIINAGNLGYCKFLKFKCASRRTCDAWVTGGPLVDSVAEAETGTAYAKDISREFRKLGYLKIGSGADSTIWAKDDSHVIKILMPEDEGSQAVEVFKKFYEFCQERSDIPCLPVFNEYNTIDVLDKEYIQIDMERLYPIKKNTFEEAMIWYLSDYVAHGTPWPQVKQELSDPHPWINSHWPRRADQLAAKVSSLSGADESAWNLLYSVMAMLYKTGRINKLGWDLHTENVMRRANGQLVIIDPWFADASLLTESTADNVNETFDQPYKLRWEKGDYGDVDAVAKMDDGNYLSIMFNKGYSQGTKEEAWSVEFYRNNSQEVTGEGDAQRVFATVLSAIQTFIKKYKPNRVIFSASKDNWTKQQQDSESRASLYDRLVQRYARTWGFRAFRADTGDKVIYELSRINKEVDEARTNPDQNPKPESGFKELAAVTKTIADPENWAISMTAEPKLGINPQVGISEDTPKGIYFYPLNYALDKTRYGKLPWGHDYPYIQLFQYDRSGEMTKQTKVDPAKLKQALSQYCSEEVIQSAIDEPEYDGTPYWFIYDCLSRLGKSDETNVVRWNKVLRDLGFTSVYDDGAGWIAYNEPTQGVVLDPRVIKKLKTIVNKKQAGVVTPAVIEQAIFETMDMELAANRAWQAYDPDGSKLRAAAKEYAKKPEFKQYYGKPGTEEIFNKAEGMGRYGARQLSNIAYEWFKEQLAKKEAVGENFADGKKPGRKGLAKRMGVDCSKSVAELRRLAAASSGEKQRMAHWCANMKSGRNESIAEGGWASTATQNTKITPAVIEEAVGILKEFETEFNQWQAEKGLDVEIKMGRPVGSGTYYKRDLAQDPEREYGDVDVMCYIHSREGIGAARRTSEYAAAVEEFTQGHSKYSTSNGTNVIMDTSAGPVQVDLIYTYHEHANWARMLAPEYRVKGVINTSLVSSLAEVLNLSIGVQGVQVKTRAGRPVNFRQSKDTELATVSLDPENWGADIYAYYYELAHGAKPKIPSNLAKHGGLKDEQRISDIVLTIKALATDLEQAELLGTGALDHVANKQDMMQQIARVLDSKLEKVINSSKFDKAATPAAVEKANKTKLMLAKYRNEITKLLLN